MNNFQDVAQLYNYSISTLAITWVQHMFSRSLILPIRRIRRAPGPPRIYTLSRGLKRRLDVDPGPARPLGARANAHHPNEKQTNKQTNKYNQNILYKHRINNTVNILLEHAHIHLIRHLIRSSTACRC